MKKKVIFLILFIVILGLLQPQAISGGVGWVTKDSMPTPRGFIASTVVDSRIYVLGGHPGTPIFYSTNEFYDPMSDSWSTASDLPTNRGYAVAGSVNGKIYVIGGLNDPGGWNSLRVNEEYDPQTDSWTEKAPMPIWGRHAATSATVNGKIYVIGGYSPPYNAGIMLDWNEAYDPATDSWQSSLNGQLAPLPTPRRNLAAAVVDGKIYAIGGTSITSELGTNEMYDPGTDMWTMMSPMPTPREALTLAVVGDKIYAIGGRIDEPSNFQASNIVEMYDTKADAWSTVQSMPTARAYLTSQTISGTIYVIGGFAPSIGPFSANEAFSPTPKLTSVGPSDVWIGLKNSDDVGTNFDLKAELYLGGVLVGSGEFLNVPGGSSGFNNAHLREIPMTLISSEQVQGQTLEYKLYVRIAQESRHRAGTARLWFNDGQANSSVDIAIDGSVTRYYLRSSFTLSTELGVARQYLDVQVDRAKNGNPYKPFGTWTIIL